MLCSGWYHRRSAQFLNSDTFCSFPAWIFLYIINASPRRGSCLQLLSKARADTELPLLLTKRLSDRGCTSNTESKENCRGSNNVRGKWGGRGKEGGGSQYLCQIRVAHFSLFHVALKIGFTFVDVPFLVALS